MLELEHFWPFGSYLKYCIGLAPPGKREREGRPPRCSTSWKKGHHSVNSGPILAIFGSKWPQRIDLSIGTRVLCVKMAKSYSIPWLNRPCLIRFSFPASPDCLPRAFWAICSHFCIKEHGAKWKISSLWSFRAQDGQDWTKIDQMAAIFIKCFASTS